MLTKEEFLLRLAMLLSVTIKRTLSKAVGTARLGRNLSEGKQDL